MTVLNEIYYKDNLLDKAIFKNKILYLVSIKWTILINIIING